MGPSQDVETGRAEEGKGTQLHFMNEGSNRSVRI